jgi:hypothetical protein
MIVSNGTGDEIVFDGLLLQRIALSVRSSAKNYLKSISIPDLHQLLVDFVVSDPDFCSAMQIKQDASSYYSQAFDDLCLKIAKRLSISAIFSPCNTLFLIPLSTIRTATALKLDTFFIFPPAILCHELERWYDHDKIDGALFPPMPMHSGMSRTPVTSWLGIRAPSRSIAFQMRDAILGAVALLPHPMERYMFTLRKVARGYCSFDKAVTFHSGEPHTPRLGDLIDLSDADLDWLTELCHMLESEDVAQRRKTRSLEYFYRAWIPEPSRRFSTLFASLDAIFGDPGRATQSIIDAVNLTLKQKYTDSQLRLMLGLRGSVIHGGAPNIFESEKYYLYFKQYHRDPVSDFEHIVSLTLIHHIFRGKMAPRSHTHAELISSHLGIVV